VHGDGQDRKPGGCSLAGQREQGVDVKVCFDEIGQQFHAAFACCGEADSRGRESEGLGEEGGAELVAFQGAVPHRAEDQAHPGAAEELVGAVFAGDPPVVDLVPGGIGAQGRAVGQAQHFVGVELGRHGEQAQPGGACTCRAFHAVGVVDVGAEHLEAAADAQQRSSRAYVLLDRGIEAA